MHHFWELISYIANTLIFFLSGVVIAESILRSHDKIQGRDWSYLLALYVFVQLSRAILVVVLYLGLRYFDYGLTWKEATLLVWAGLRGVVALSRSLSVAVSGVVFLTLIINGSTMQFLLHFLRIDTITETKLRMLEFAKHEMHSKALEAFGELGEDEDLRLADWNTIRKYVTCLPDEDESPAEHPHAPPSFALPDGEHLKQQMHNTHLRFLNDTIAMLLVKSMVFRDHWPCTSQSIVRISKSTRIRLLQLELRCWAWTPSALMTATSAVLPILVLSVGFTNGWSA